MTNEQIIFNAACSLMEQGIIGGTGKFVTVEDEDSKKIQLEAPEAIHTYAKWKELDRQVKKGEKAIAKITIWKAGKRKAAEEENANNEETEEKLKLFMKTAAFFKLDQTEAIKKEA